MITYRVSPETRPHDRHGPSAQSARRRPRLFHCTRDLRKHTPMTGRTFLRRFVVVTVVVISSAVAAATRADIFQWEYINPADPGHGKRQSTTLAPDGAGVDAGPGVTLFGNLTMAY